MSRKKHALPQSVRTELTAQANTLAEKLMEGGLHRDDAAEAVAAVLGEAAEAAVEMVGAPDLAGDIVDSLVRSITLKIAEAIKPDPQRLMERAVEAMTNGNARKSKRLMARAERLLAALGQKLAEHAID